MWTVQFRQKKRRMEDGGGGWKAPDSHRDCLCEGWRCCHLLSPLCACIMPECPLSKHACAHERPLRLWACARPQKRVNASVRLAGLLRRARTGLQAGILMSVFWLEREECNLQSSDSKAPGARDVRFDREERKIMVWSYYLIHSCAITSAACDGAARYFTPKMFMRYMLLKWSQHSCSWIIKNKSKYDVVVDISLTGSTAGRLSIIYRV